MRKAANQILREVQISARILYPYDNALISFVQATDDLRCDWHTADIREVIKEQSQTGVSHLFDDPFIKSECPIVCDATAIDTGWHQQHAGNASLDGMKCQLHNIGNGEGPRRHDNPTRINARRNQFAECLGPVCHGEFSAFACRAKQRDAVAPLLKQHPATCDKPLNVWTELLGHRRRNGDHEAIGLWEAVQADLSIVRCGSLIRP